MADIILYPEKDPPDIAIVANWQRAAMIGTDISNRVFL